MDFLSKNFRIASNVTPRLFTVFKNAVGGTYNEVIKYHFTVYTGIKT